MDQASRPRRPDRGADNPLKPDIRWTTVAAAVAMGTGKAEADRRLVAYLRSLAVPNHLPLLRILQVPRTVAEIRLVPSRRSGGLAPDRAVSRQAVSAHLRSLRALGLVIARRSTRHGRPVLTYVVNHARMFALTDDLRRLALLQPVGEAGAATAIPSSDDGGARVRIPSGPALVLGYGPVEAAIFPLRGDGPWVIGRDPRSEVPLQHDPFVSLRNARLHRKDGRIWMECLPAARNGARLNWTLVKPGVALPLAAGDSIGVGRSLLFVRGV